VKGDRSGGLRQKSASWSGAVLFFLRISEMKGINFFSCVQDLLDEALSPHYRAFYFGSNEVKGNVLRGINFGYVDYERIFSEGF